MKYVELLGLELAFHKEHTSKLKEYLTKLQSMNAGDDETSRLLSFLLLTYSNALRNSDKTYVYYHNLKNSRT